jgi:hypothetical protein
MAAASEGSSLAYAIGSKQIYAMHYYDASVGADAARTGSQRGDAEHVRRLFESITN